MDGVMDHREYSLIRLLLRRKSMQTNYVKSYVVLTVLMTFLSAAFAWADEYTRPEILISPKGLTEIMNRAHVRIVDARTGKDYKKGHISGAVSLPLSKVADFKARKKNGYPVSPEEAENLFSAAGIDSDTLVVVYDGGEGPFASGVWFALEFFGHEKVKVLNGGLRKWRKEGHPVTKAVPVVEKKKFIAEPHPGKVVTLKWLKKNLRNKDIMIVDTRSFKEYIGERVFKGAARGGHIPGAVHLDWKKLSGKVETFKSADSLKKVLARRGITEDTRIVTYCQQGIGRSTDLILAMKLIGYDNVLEYTGSWEEWSKDPRLPIEK